MSKPESLPLSELPELPPGWCWAKLEEISEVEGGITKDQNRRSDTMREVPYLRVANVQRGYLDLSEMKTILAEEEDIDHLRLQLGDILFTEGGDRDKLGRGWVWNGEIDECIHQNHIFRARPNRDVVEPKFVSWHGNLFGQAWFTRTGKQTTNLASINKGILRRFPVPVPPLNEQRRIVARVDELLSDLDAGVSALERARANLKKYRAAVLRAAVTGELTADWRAAHPNVEPATKLLDRILAERRRKWEAEQQTKYAVTGRTPPKDWRGKYREPITPDQEPLPELPDNWCWASFEQCAYEATVGHVGPMKDRYIDDGIPFLRSQNVRPLRFDREGLKYIPADFHEHLSKSKLFGGELLVVRSGNIGEACVYPETEPEANCADLVITRLVPGVLPSFAAIFVNSPFGRFLVGGRRTGSALSHFNVGAMEHSPLPLPPLKEQEEIVAEVERQLSNGDATKAYIEASLKRATRLRQSILKEAFAGRLVPQDPKDEPAAVLLDRIRTSSASVNGKAKPRTRNSRQRELFE